MTQALRNPADFRAACEAARRSRARVGLVPTMGNLHAGHLALVHSVRRLGSDFVAVTAFVNPLQFGPTEDFTRYPRTLEADLSACRELGVDVVFAPPTDAMYPSDFQTHVEVGAMTLDLEGAVRPGHFRGVTTILANLFGLSGPCIAVFGQKDYQQFKTIYRMVRDLAIPV